MAFFHEQVKKLPAAGGMVDVVQQQNAVEQVAAGPPAGGESVVQIGEKHFHQQPFHLLARFVVGVPERDQVGQGVRADRLGGPPRALRPLEGPGPPAAQPGPPLHGGEDGHRGGRHIRQFRRGEHRADDPDDVVAVALRPGPVAQQPGDLVQGLDTIVQLQLAAEDKQAGVEPVESDTPITGHLPGKAESGPDQNLAGRGDIAPRRRPPSRPAQIQPDARHSRAPSFDLVEHGTAANARGPEQQDNRQVTVPRLTGAVQALRQQPPDRFLPASGDGHSLAHRTVRRLPPDRRETRHGTAVPIADTISPGHMRISIRRGTENDPAGPATPAAPRSAKRRSATTKSVPAGRGQGLGPPAQSVQPLTYRVTHGPIHPDA